MSIIRFVENGLWCLASFLRCLGSSSRLHSAWVNCRVASGSTTKAGFSHISLAANLEHNSSIVSQLGRVSVLSLTPLYCISKILRVNSVWFRLLFVDKVWF